jgi:4-amino-4-deoxy-L-arabinose transferase-like glycosyltransferase
MELVTRQAEVAPRGRLTMQPPARGPRGPLRPLGPRRRRVATWPRAGLLALLLATLGLRLWGIKQGLPFSYNSDEAQHFVPKAIQFFSGDWNPHYFLNPPAYSYLLAIVLELWFGSVDAAVRAFTINPTAVFVIARVVCALMGTGSVWLLYGTGVRLFGRAGPALLGAAVYGFAFLPIFYSHLALNDVPTLFFVCLALYGVAGVWAHSRGRDFLLAGLAVGLAAATKYTGGWVLLLFLLAAARSAAGLAGEVAEGERPWDRVVLWTSAALLLALGGFSLGNPYWFLDFHGFITGVSAQASATSGASEPAKLGTAPGGGILYYLWTFSWGLGLGPVVAAVAGVGVLARRRRWWALALFVPAQVAFIIFMGLQQRYFGRWLMPIFPTVALLAGWTGAEVIDGMRRLRRPVPGVVAGLLVGLALLTQSVVSVIHNDRVLSRPYTTNLARAWMLTNIPAGENVYIEPIIPGNWTSDVGDSNPFEPDGSRWYQYPTWLSNLGVDGKPLAHGAQRFVTLDQYEKTLYPGLIQRYEQHAFCWVVSGTLQSGRAFVQPGEAPQAVAYYRELARVGQLVYKASPYASGANPVPFGFDWTIDYYPRQYRLPGPVISIYHLSGGACAA